MSSNKFAIVSNDGIVKRTVICDPAISSLQAGADESVIECSDEIGSDSHYYDMDASSFVVLPERPFFFFEFDVKSKNFIDPRSLDELKAAKWQEVKGERYLAETGGFQFNGMTFDSSQEAQSKIQGAVQLALLSGDDFTIDWTLANNSVVSLRKADMVGLGLALGNHVSDIYSRARALRSEIDEAKSVEDLQAISW